MAIDIQHDVKTPTVRSTGNDLTASVKTTSSKVLTANISELKLRASRHQAKDLKSWIVSNLRYVNSASQAILQNLTTKRSKLEPKRCSSATTVKDDSYQTPDLRK